MSSWLQGNVTNVVQLICSCCESMIVTLKLRQRDVFVFNQFKISPLHFFAPTPHLWRSHLRFIWFRTLITSAAKWHLCLASRTLLKMCVKLRFSCPTHPYSLLKMYILKEIINHPSWSCHFQKLPVQISSIQHIFHLRVSKTIGCVNGSKDCIELRAAKRCSLKTLSAFIAGCEGWMWR